MDNNSIKAMVYSLGADVCGIADMERFKDAPDGFSPSDIYTDARSVIVYGKQFPKGLFELDSNVPYTFFKNKLVEMVDNISVELTMKIEEEGFTAIPVPSDEPYEYWDSENRHGMGILSLKHAAKAAGIGSIGKNTLLINEKFGNRLCLGAVISDAELIPDELTSNLCPKNCNICLKVCPQSALDGVTIVQKKCREICSSFTEGGGMILSCNICRKVCPFSKR